jgi:hypothetical protein
MMFITTIYAALLVVLFVTEPIGVPLLRIEIDGWTYPYYTIGVFFLLLVATVYFLVGTYRLFIRKKKRIEPKIHYYIMNR